MQTLFSMNLNLQEIPFENWEKENEDEPIMGLQIIDLKEY